METDFTDWISFQPSNLQEEISPNPQTLSTNNFGFKIVWKYLSKIELKLCFIADYLQEHVIWHLGIRGSSWWETNELLGGLKSEMGQA